MNIKTPLPAALLLAASSASAQLLSPGPGFSMTSPNAGSFSLPAGPVDDVVFKCNTPPYIPCTDVHMNKREAIRIAGRCPEPASSACMDYLMRTSGSANPVQTIAAYNPPEGTKWASPDCTHIPCRLADSPSAPSVTAAPKPGDPEFIGPIQDPPPAPRAAQDRAALADARSEIGQDGIKGVVDLGNGRFAKMRDDGTAEVCGRASCEAPVPADAVKNPKVAAWVVENKGYAGVDSPGGGGGIGINSTPAGRSFTPDDAGKSAPSGPGAPPADTRSGGGSGEDTAYNSGVQLGGETGDLGGPSGPSSGGSGGSSGRSGSGGYGAETASTKVEKVGTAEFKKLLGAPDAYTYPVLGALSEKAANEINPNAFDAEAKAKEDAKVELKFRGTQTESQ